MGDDGKEYFVVIEKDTFGEINHPIAIGRINFRDQQKEGTIVGLSSAKLLQRMSKADPITFFRIVETVHYPSDQKSVDVLILGKLEDREQKSLALDLSVVPNRTTRGLF